MNNACINMHLVKNTFHPKRRKETKNGPVKEAPNHKEFSRSNHKKNVAMKKQHRKTLDTIWTDQAREANNPQKIQS
jgi:hypothetical protein